jgi:Domain of unknown function (DUF4157)
VRSGRERRLTADEATALGGLPLPVDLTRVRLHRGGGGLASRALRSCVLRLTGGRAIALGNDVFLPDACCRSLPVLAHELTHCGQYQAWGAVRYYVRGVADRLRELRHRGGLGPSPYDYGDGAPRPFTTYGMEQQGQIAEDWMRGSLEAAARLTAPTGDPPTMRTRSRRGPRSSP